MTTLAPLPPATAGQVEDLQVHKIVRAAHQFEALLLNSLFGSLEHTFSALPGNKLQDESENYHAMGMQALATSLADKGGIGIADMIIRSLSTRQPPNQESQIHDPQ